MSMTDQEKIQLRHAAFVLRQEATLIPDDEDWQDFEAHMSSCPICQMPQFLALAFAAAGPVQPPPSSASTPPDELLN